MNQDHSFEDVLDEDYYVMIDKRQSHDGRTIQKRAAIEDGIKYAKLMALFGVDYTDWIATFKKLDEDVSKYMFASVFENSNICGHTGIHAFIVNLDISRDPNESLQFKSHRITASISISLDTYDKMRSNKHRPWQRVGREKFPPEFPPYTRLG